RVLGLAVGVDVQRRDLGPGRAVLAVGDPDLVGGVEAAGEDVGLRAEVDVGLVPGHPRHGAAGAGEVDRRRLGLLAGVDVQRGRGALRDPLAALEGADEDLLLAAGLLLERGPGDPGAAGGQRAADDVGGAGAVRRVDAGGGIVVDLAAG